MDKQEIQHLQTLGRELAEETNNRKHKFDERWVNNLIDFYSKNKGKEKIHLSDLPDNVYVKLDKKGRVILIKKLVATEKHDNITRSIKKCLENENKFVSLRNLRAFLQEKIDDFESHVNEVKTTKSGIGKITKKLKFPIQLDNTFGALLIGNYPDTTIKTGEFVSKDKLLLDNLEKYFKIYIGEVKSVVWGNSMYRMQLSPLIKIFYRLAGLDNTTRQIVTNVTFPQWVFTSNKHFQRTLLRRLWDAEGSAPVMQKMCLGQSVVLSGINEEIPFYPKRRLVTSIKNNDKIRTNPPNLLVATQLLLYKFGIKSYIKPHRLYRKQNGSVVCDWQLLITKHSNIQKFYNEIGFSIPRKQTKLKTCLSSYTRNFPKPPLIRDKEILSLIKDMETFTIADIRGKITLSNRTLTNYMTRLKKDKKIEKIGTVPQKNTSSYFNEYRLVRGGLSGDRIRAW